MSLTNSGQPQKSPALLAELVSAGHLIPSGVRGVYARGSAFERVLESAQRLISRLGAFQGAEVVTFPPVMSRPEYLPSGHIETMPHLLGSVHAFDGDREEQKRLLLQVRKEADWSDSLSMTDVVMVPAACYPLYPAAAGTLPVGGRTVDLRSYVFRQEPSDDPVRMRSFQQREFVRLGSPAEAVEHRDAWIPRAREMFHSIGLVAESIEANDPFFGPARRVLAAAQRGQALKFELVVPIAPEGTMTAIASSNLHLDHFSTKFGIRTHDGGWAHTSCVAFGLERIGLALLKTHGMDPARWPTEIRAILDL